MVLTVGFVPPLKDHRIYGSLEKGQYRIVLGVEKKKWIVGISIIKIIAYMSNLKKSLSGDKEQQGDEVPTYRTCRRKVCALLSNTIEFSLPSP